jgi:hypothetical protein
MLGFWFCYEPACAERGHVAFFLFLFLFLASFTVLFSNHTTHKRGNTMKGPIGLSWSSNSSPANTRPPLDGGAASSGEIRPEELGRDWERRSIRSNHVALYVSYMRACVRKRDNQERAFVNQLFLVCMRDVLVQVVLADLFQTISLAD